MPNSALH